MPTLGSASHIVEDLEFYRTNHVFAHIRESSLHGACRPRNPCVSYASHNYTLVLCNYVFSFIEFPVANPDVAPHCHLPDRSVPTVLNPMPAKWLLVLIGSRWNISYSVLVANPQKSIQINKERLDSLS